jgi:outer membrane protein assembly factor BamB
MKKAVLFLFLILLAVSFTGVEVIRAQSSTSDWPIFGHDSAHTGCSNSSVPGANAVVIWKYQTFPKWYSVYAAEPVVENGRLYVIDSTGENYRNNEGVYLLCFNASSGQLLWNQTLGNPPPSSFFPTFSIAVSNGLVYTDSAAYNALNGELSFKYPNSAYSAPIIFDNQLYFNENNGGISVLDAKTGAINWRNNTLFFLAAANGVIFLSYDQGFMAINASTHHEIWRNNMKFEYPGQVSVAMGRLFFATLYNAYCLDASNGLMLWNTTIDGNGVNVVVSDGLVYAGTCALDASTGALVWNNTFINTNTTIGVTPAATAQGVLYVYANIDNGNGGLYGTDEDLIAFNLATGEKLWQYTFGTRDTYQYSFPVIANGMVYVGTQEGLFAFGDSGDSSQNPPVPKGINDFIIWVALSLLIIVIVAGITIVLSNRRKKSALG